MNILDKLESGARLSFEDGVKLYELDIFTLGKYADKKKRELYANKVFFNINRHINPSNECVDICKFCAYSASRKNPNPYSMNFDEIMEVVRDAIIKGAKELHIVSAHKYNLAFYTNLFKSIKSEFPQIHLKALTSAEVDFIHRLEDISYQEILEQMISSGVDSMPGGGAEIFDEKVRDYICKGKVSSSNWLLIHKLWHKMGKKSNATMLFGHIETRENRINHLIRLRDLQDETLGFNSFIPLLYQKENNFLNVLEFPTGQEVIKTIAISRLMLDNIPHIKSYWASLGINLALVGLEFGADDIDGTIQKESIQSSAGANSSNGISQDELIHLIKDAGFIAIERDSLYSELKEW